VAKAFIFPGQGTQKVGMAAAFVSGFESGMRVMEEVENAISFDISRMINEGPIDELTKTENAQPAIFATGMACITILEKEYGYEITKKAKYMAGHSLGEYTALCASGAISISDAARLLRIRGGLMSKACSDRENYSMVALLGVSSEVIGPLVAPYQSGRNICVIANDNSESQVVISGHRKAVMSVCEEANYCGLVKAINLNVDGPFHSPLMSQVAIEFDEVLANVSSYSNCNVPVIMNTTASPFTQKENLHSNLVGQITGRVRWRETIDFLMNDKDIDEVIEIAPGRTLSKMLKRSYSEANVRSLETVAQIEEFIKAES
jgi:[acyl-carrier-protein] S-malonyltransferase